MNIDQALAINLRARKTGTLKYNDQQKAMFKEAREVIHVWSMANEPGYARRFHEMYSRMARDLGRLDLIVQGAAARAPN